MKWIKALSLAALATGATLTLSACEERETPRIQDETEQLRENTREGAEDLRDEGTGGAGDVDIGEKEGVIKDGEGPLENEPTRPGENPGVIDDGEGPFENERGPFENNQ